MNAESIRKLLRQRPFAPFKLRMTNRDVFEVRHPELALVRKKEGHRRQSGKRSLLDLLATVWASIESSQAA